MDQIVVDLGFGDSGKGTIVDALARENPNTSAVVRYNGGAQAAHNVVTDDGRHHTFAQFGSATFVPGVRTFLGPRVMVNPGNLRREARALEANGIENTLERLSIHPNALIITPYHQRMNIVRTRQLGDHGTTGQGIGETMKDSLCLPQSENIYANDLANHTVLKEKLNRVKWRKIAEASQLGMSSLILESPGLSEEFLEDAEWLAGSDVIRNDLVELAHDGDLIFEGAQGVLLDQDFGFHPHTTWSKTTTAHAQEILAYPSFRLREAKTIGVIRSYMTRHGNGPFVSEADLSFEEPHNREDGWAGKFRRGYLDLVALRYAVGIQPIDELAVTHMDAVGETTTITTSYLYSGDLPDLEPYFSLDRQVIRDITPRPLDTGSHAHMEAITTRLLKCVPINVPVPGDQLIPMLEDRLGAPVTITSSSPTASGKEYMKSVQVFLP